MINVISIILLSLFAIIWFIVSFNISHDARKLYEANTTHIPQYEEKIPVITNTTNNVTINDVYITDNVITDVTVSADDILIAALEEVENGTPLSSLTIEQQDERFLYISNKRPTFIPIRTYNGKSSNIEREIRQLLEQKLHPYKFYCCRPNILRNPLTGRNLEIDCACPCLGLWVEVNGPHHYSPFKYGGNDGDKTLNDKYIKQCKHDAYKRKVAVDNNIHFICVATNRNDKFAYINNIISSIEFTRLCNLGCQYCGQ